LRCGLATVIISATVSAVVARLVGSEETTAALPPACTAPQNGTATCAPFEIVGQHLWDSATQTSQMQKADTLEDCCRGCDELEDCQGWMFEKLARRCRWVRFQEEPCRSDPGHLSCRCVTHFGTTFGFKPTSKIIWVQRAA